MDVNEFRIFSFYLSFFGVEWRALSCMANRTAVELISACRITAGGPAIPGNTAVKSPSRPPLGLLGNLQVGDFWALKAQRLAAPVGNPARAGIGWLS
jgi:hypothetical protein